MRGRDWVLHAPSKFQLGFMILQFEVGTKGLVSGFLVGLRSFRKIQVKGGLKLAQGVGQDSLRPSGQKISVWVQA